MRPRKAGKAQWISTNHGRTDPAHRSLQCIFMRQDPLSKGHFAAVTMLLAVSRAYSYGRGM